jgi:nucleoside-diphosphate-sugar epimerase
MTSVSSTGGDPSTHRVVVLGGAGHLGRFVANELAAPSLDSPTSARPIRDVVAQARGLDSFADGRSFDPRLCRIASPTSAFSPELREACASARAVVVCLPVQLAEEVAPQLESVVREAGSSPRVVVFSSTRRHSQVADESVAAVARAEARWAASPLRPIILRATMIFGDQRDRNLERVFAWSRRHRWIPVPSGRVGRVQPVYAGDLALAARAALDAPDSLLDELPPDRAVELGGPEPVEVRELLRLCHSLMGRRILVPVPAGILRLASLVAPMLPRSLRVSRAQIERLAEEKTVDLEPAKRLLGFEPTPLKLALAMKLKMCGRALGADDAAHRADDLSA